LVWVALALSVLCAATTFFFDDSLFDKREAGPLMLAFCLAILEGVFLPATPEAPTASTTGGDHKMMGRKRWKREVVMNAPDSAYGPEGPSKQSDESTTGPFTLIDQLPKVRPV